MKKGIIISWITIAISLFAIVRDTNAISWNGSATRSMPDVYSGSVIESLSEGPRYNGFSSGCIQQTQIGDSESYGTSSIDNTQPSYCSLSASGNYKISSFFTVTEYDLNLIPGGENVLYRDSFYSDSILGYWAGLYLYKTGTGYQFNELVINDLSSVVSNSELFSFSSGFTSEGDFPEKIAISRSVLLLQDILNNDIYLLESTNCYYNSGTIADCAILTYDDINPLGLLISSNGMYSAYIDAPYVSGINRYVSPYLLENNVEQSDKFFSFMIDLNFGLPDWYGTTIVTGYVGPTEPPVDYYADCEGFTDFGCYVAGFGNFILGTISDFLDFLFPDISFSGNFDSCGSFSTSGGTLPIGQRFGNIIAIINPFPPDDLQNICTLYGEKEIIYQAAIPDSNIFELYIPGVAPELENVDLQFAFGQTPIDLIIIFASMMVIFYHRSKHD